MQIINTDGLVLLGPGSEWLWTAISGIVLAVTFLAIYRQLALARSANAFEQMDRIAVAWESELAARHKLAILEAGADGAPLESIPEGSATFVENFWEHQAALVRAGHIDLKLMYPQFGPIIRYWHAAVAPNIERYRRDNQVRVFEYFDWLADQMARVDRRRGVNVAIDEGYVRATAPQRIARHRDEIAQAERLRAAAIANPPSPTSPRSSARPRRRNATTEP